MKIAIDARIISTSTGRYVHRLLEYLQEIDTENHYFVLVRSKDLGYWKPKKDNFTVIEADFPPFTFREQFNLAWLLYTLRVDLVHFTIQHHSIFYFKRHILTIHDLTLIDVVNRRKSNPLQEFYKYTLKPAIFKRFLWLAVRTAAHIITPTNHVRKDVITRMGIPKEKVSYTYEAADALAGKPQPIPKLASKRFILSVGNAYPYKNLRRLVDAFKLINDPGLTLVFAGKPDYFYDELANYVKDTAVDNVSFAGFVTDAELLWLYQNARLQVFPSLMEGFGLPGMEAMLNGLPVAAANASCLPEVYADAAAYFNPLDVADMAKVIKTTLADENRLKELKAAGIHRAKQFSWSRLADQTFAIYKQVEKS